MLINLPFLLIVSRKIKIYYRNLERDRNLARIGELSRQVAHDIRSPLSALNVLSSHLSFSKVEQKTMFETVVARLTRIADELLDQNRIGEPCRSTTAFPSPILDSKITSFELSEAIRHLTEEKNLEWSHRELVQLRAYMDDLSDIIAEKEVLVRVLSNLLNNAVEAKASFITISTSLENDFLAIVIRDNGLGMNSDLCAKAGTEGFSHGKAKGNGLGLFHAYASLKNGEDPCESFHNRIKGLRSD
ncbi:MAG: hypothetical protein HC883_05195 [Bdellovibrionaceae bacterium]|nr:hypothetical protein [Pseudobdellovibrionaceae bacterium]